MSQLEQLRAAEDFIEAGIARGETLEELRRSLSARILGHEIRELCPDLPLDFLIKEIEDFYKQEERK